jgi:hypothetical protein
LLARKCNWLSKVSQKSPKFWHNWKFRKTQKSTKFYFNENIFFPFLVICYVVTMYKSKKKISLKIFLIKNYLIKIIKSQFLHEILTLRLNISGRTRLPGSIFFSQVDITITFQKKKKLSQATLFDQRYRHFCGGG